MILISCKSNPKETLSADSAIIKAGDIIVSNYYSDALVLLDKDGNYKETLLNLVNNSEQVLGVVWNSNTKEVNISINGSPDRVMAISPLDGSVREVFRNTNYNGNAFGLLIDSNQDYVVIESHSLERFTSVGSRINNGTYPATNLMTNLSQISLTSQSQILACAYGVDRVRLYNSALAQQAEAQSGIAGTTNAYGCHELSNGNIAVAWEGSTDTVRIYNANLSSTIADFSDTSVLSSPRGITTLSNGNILVADAGYHYLVEIDPQGNFIRSIGGGFLNYPWHLIEVPTY